MRHLKGLLVKLILSYISWPPFNDPVHKPVHLSMLSFNSEAMLKSFMNLWVLICILAHWTFKVIEFYSMYFLQLFNVNARISLAIMKSNAERRHPCRIPLFILIVFDSQSLFSITNLGLEFYPCLKILSKTRLFRAFNINGQNQMLSESLD